MSTWKYITINNCVENLTWIDRIESSESGNVIFFFPAPTTKQERNETRDFMEEEMIIEMIIEVITLTETHCFQVFKRLCATNPAVITTVFSKVYATNF